MMTKYVLTYHGGAHDLPTAEAEMEKLMAAWGAWFEQLGDALVDGGAPFGPSAALTADGTITEGGIVSDMNGYGIIEAANMEEAAKLAGGCPVLTGGATVQISEALEI